MSSRCLKAASVELGLRTGLERLFQTDGPAMPKPQRLYVRVESRGSTKRSFYVLTV